MRSGRPATLPVVDKEELDLMLSDLRERFLTDTRTHIGAESSGWADHGKTTWTSCVAVRSWPRRPVNPSSLA